MPEVGEHLEGEVATVLGPDAFEDLHVQRMGWDPSLACSVDPQPGYPVGAKQRPGVEAARSAAPSPTLTAVPDKTTVKATSGERKTTSG